MRFVNYCIPFLFTICTVSQLFGIGFVNGKCFYVTFKIENTYIKLNDWLKMCY